MNMSFVIRRTWRVVTGKKGIYGEMGKKNHFAQGVLIYEQATIGNYNYFAPYTIVNNASIGNYCSIGPGGRIGLGEHDMTAISMRPIVANGDGNMELFDLEHPTIIGNDVWVGANVIIKQGVKIGTGAVIGANSLVLKDVPSYAVVYGSPARYVRMRFNEEQIKKIERSRWYEHDVVDAKRIIKGIIGVNHI